MATALAKTQHRSGHSTGASSSPADHMGGQTATLEQTPKTVPTAGSSQLRVGLLQGTSLWGPPLLAAGPISG